jgi:aryl-alcohol dehydrogenase-like predicted oxidoreductase
MAGVTQSHCDRLLNGILDKGINLIDTAASYGDSEEKIGRAVSHRRREYILITKCGYKLKDDDLDAWTGENVRHSLARSLQWLRTDAVDILLLNSCPAENLKNSRMIDALVGCREDGLTRFIGYSGDGDAALSALGMGVFDCLEIAVNIFDQQCLETVLPKAAEAGVGVVAKRPMASAFWHGHDVDNPAHKTYTNRREQMGFTPSSLGFEGDWLELGLRFTAHQQLIHSTLTATRTIEHFNESLENYAKGPLPDAVVQELRNHWGRHDDGSWTGRP